MAKNIKRTFLKLIITLALIVAWGKFTIFFGEILEQKGGAIIYYVIGCAFSALFIVGILALWKD